MTAKFLTFAASAALAAATALVLLRQEREMDALHADAARAKAEAARLAAAATVTKQSAADLATREETQRRSLAAARERLSPDQRAVVDAELAALVRAPASAASASPRPLLVQNSSARLYLPALLARPDYAHAAAAVERITQEKHYAPLLAKLALSPEKRARVVDFLTDYEMSRQDIASLNPGAPPTSLAAHRLSADREWRTRATPELGADVVREITAFRNQLILYDTVREVEQRSSYTDTPLRASEAAALFAALDTFNAKRNSSRPVEFPDAMLAQLRPTLSASQLAAIMQIRDEHTARLETLDTLGKLAPP